MWVRLRGVAGVLGMGLGVDEREEYVDKREGYIDVIVRNVHNTRTQHTIHAPQHYMQNTNVSTPTPTHPPPRILVKHVPQHQVPSAHQ